MRSRLRISAPVAGPYIILGLVLLLFLPAVAAPAMADDWPMFLHDRYHRGITSSGAPEHPTILWERTVSPSGIYASTSVHDGTVFVGGVDRTMYALDADDGEVKWSYKTPDVQNGQGIDGTVAISGGRVYFGSDDFRFYALDEADGSLVWSYELATTGFNPQTYGLQASPVVVDGVVYAGGDMSQGDNFDLVDNLVALDAATGEARWTFDTNGRVYTSPAIDGDHLFVATFQGSFFAIDLSSGGPLRSPVTFWERDYGHGFMGSPMLYNKKLFIGEGQYQEAKGSFLLYSYTYDGAVIWKYEVEYPIISTPTYYDGNIYFADYGGNVHAVREEGNGDGTTNLVWSHHLSDREIWSTTLLVDGRIYIGSLDHRLYCLDAAGNGDGTTYEIWNMTLDGEVWSSPVPADDGIYITTMAGTIYCIGEDPDPVVTVPPEVEIVMVDPYEVRQGREFRLTVRFEEGGDLILVDEVVVDLTSLGGEVRTHLNDIGINGDAALGDGTYSLTHRVATDGRVGDHELDVEVVLTNGKKMSESVVVHVKEAKKGGGDDEKGLIPFPGSLAVMAAVCTATALSTLASPKRKG